MKIATLQVSPTLPPSTLQKKIADHSVIAMLHCSFSARLRRTERPYYESFLHLKTRNRVNTRPSSRKAVVGGLWGEQGEKIRPAHLSFLLELPIEKQRRIYGLFSLPWREPASPSAVRRPHSGRRPAFNSLGGQKPCTHF